MWTRLLLTVTIPGASMTLYVYSLTTHQQSTTVVVTMSTCMHTSYVFMGGSDLAEQGMLQEILNPSPLMGGSLFNSLETCYLYVYRLGISD